MRRLGNEIKEKFLELYATSFNISATCKKLNICRDVYYDWIKKDENFAKKVREVEESVIDAVENALIKKALDGDVKAQIYFLKTKAKSRGWGAEEDFSLQLPSTLKIEIVRSEGASENS